MHLTVHAYLHMTAMHLWMRAMRRLGHLAVVSLIVENSQKTNLGGTVNKLLFKLVSNMHYNYIKINQDVLIHIKQYQHMI